MKESCLLLSSLQSPGHLGPGSVQAGPTRLSWSRVVVSNVPLHLAKVGCLDEAEGAKEDRGGRTKCGEGWWTLQRTRTRHFVRIVEALIKRLPGWYWPDLWSASCVTVSNCCITAELQTAFKLDL